MHIHIMPFDSKATRSIPLDPRRDGAAKGSSREAATTRRRSPSGVGRHPRSLCRVGVQ